MPEPSSGSTLEIGRSLTNREERGDWEFDAPLFKPGERGSYDSTFSELLERAGIASFTEFLKQRMVEGSKAHVLDLFGSGWYVGAPRNADSVTGFRLNDNTVGMKETINAAIKDEPEWTRFAEQLRYAKGVVDAFSEDPSCQVLEGNAYKSSSWVSLGKNMGERGISKFDLITAKPEGAFSPRHIAGDVPSVTENRTTYGRFFLRMLERAYRHLSSDGGMIVTQVPEFLTQKVEQVVGTMREEGRIEVFTEQRIGSEGCSGLLIRRNPKSVSSIEDLLLRKTGPW